MVDGAQKVVRLRTWQARKQRHRIWPVVVLIMLGLATAVAYRSILARPPIVTRSQPPSTQGTGAYEVIDGDTIRASTV